MPLPLAAFLFVMCSIPYITLFLRTVGQSTLVNIRQAFATEGNKNAKRNAVLKCYNRASTGS